MERNGSVWADWTDASKHSLQEPPVARAVRWVADGCVGAMCGAGEVEEMKGLALERLHKAPGFCKCSQVDLGSDLDGFDPLGFV